MNKKRALVVIIDRMPENYSAHIEGIGNILSTGKTLEEVKKNIQEGIDIFLETCADCDMEIPVELQGEYELEFKHNF